MSRRLRKHANPFNVTAKVGPIDRLACFGREGPLELDIGCGNGAFLFERACNHPGVDFVGLEVRRPLVEQILRRREDGPRNVVAFHANVHVNLDLAPVGALRGVHIHFPDPCFKRRHQKRRILQPRVVLALAESLEVGGFVYLQSDVQPLAEEMYALMAAEPAFDSELDPSMAVPSPFAERTDWERHHEGLGEPVYRMLFVKRRPASGRLAAFEPRDIRPIRSGVPSR